MSLVELGRLRLTDLNQTERVLGGTTTKEVDVPGLMTLYQVRGTRWTMSIADCAWENGERDVRVVNRGDAPQIFDFLRSKNRMTVEPHRNVLKARLSQSLIGANDRPVRRLATLAELTSAAGVDVRAKLLELGGIAVDTRAELWGDDSNHRGYVEVQFPAHAALVPVAAYVLSRLAPLDTGRRA